VSKVNKGNDVAFRIGINVILLWSLIVSLVHFELLANFFSILVGFFPFFLSWSFLVRRWCCDVNECASSYVTFQTRTFTTRYVRSPRTDVFTEHNDVILITLQLQLVWNRASYYLLDGPEHDCW